MRNAKIYGSVTQTFLLDWGIISTFLIMWKKNMGSALHRFLEEKTHAAWVDSQSQTVGRSVDEMIKWYAQHIPSGQVDAQS